MEITHCVQRLVSFLFAFHSVEHLNASWFLKFNILGMNNLIKQEAKCLSTILALNSFFQRKKTVGNFFFQIGTQIGYKKT